MAAIDPAKNDKESIEIAATALANPVPANQTPKKGVAIAEEYRLVDLVEAFSVQPFV